MILQVNHDFRKNNSAYTNIEHPRWGAILGVVTTTHVKAGEELFTYYGYDDGGAMPEDYPWYWELKRQIENEQNCQQRTQTLKDAANI